MTQSPEVNELSKNAMGGTELQMARIYKYLPKELLETVQIIPTRVRELEPNKKHILYVHDLYGDPECDHLKNGGYNKFDQIVFVSHWQMQQFINYYAIPWHRCIVIENGIEPIRPKQDRSNRPVEIIYHTTPHRGLELLVPVFEELSKTYKDNIRLNVYSSFSIYGWQQRDEPYKDLFERIKAMPNARYFGAVSNQEIRRVLPEMHIFAYPSIWQETSCLALIEAMAAGLTCVHSSLGALPETAARLTNMYQYVSNRRDHANVFMQVLNYAISSWLNEPEIEQTVTEYTSEYANSVYNFPDVLCHKWQALIENL